MVKHSNKAKEISDLGPFIHKELDSTHSTTPMSVPCAYGCTLCVHTHTPGLSIVIHLGDACNL